MASTLSPSKHRTLSRQPSSPSLAVGLPPPLPESNIMTPSSPSKSLKRPRKHRQHRGDVESSATSEASGSDDERDVLATPIRATVSVDTTPKRKVLGPVESTGSASRAKKRGTLAERLQAAAQLKKSRSIGESLVTTGVEEQTLVPSTSSRRLQARQSNATGGSDKVVVCVRIKPTSSPFSHTAYEVSQTSLTLSDAHPNVVKRGGKAGREDEYTYTFDALLQAPSRTPQLYEAKVAALVDKAMKGFNSTIFAYGQTGSGKSFTMTGTQEELGIIPCAVDGVFDAINAEQDRAFLLRVSYIEIYNETLRDLLNFKRGPLSDDEKPVIHTGKGKVYVAPLVEQIVSTPQDVVDLLEKGNAGRKIGATDWNDRSSRSHCVFTIVIESRPRDGDADGDIRLSRLSLIDLAGSEKAVSDFERRGEGKHINRSLLALKTVINKLTDKKSGHVPYRDSKLTHLLENALGGDSNICVICTLSAEEEHASETLETLKFAGTCSQVETSAKKNVLQSSDRALIKAKDKEIEFLKRRLLDIGEQRGDTATGNAGQITDLADDVATMEKRKSRLNAQLAKLNAEILTSEVPRAGVPQTPTSKIKRRRISDWTPGPGGLGLGLGSPRRAVLDQRRVVSNMVRVPEEPTNSLFGMISEGQGESRQFEQDRVVSALRRSLAAKEVELSAALERVRQASMANEGSSSDLLAARQQAETLQAEQDVKLRDMHVQLEATRSELVSTIDDKTKRIDELENAILELRKSREDLAIEDQQRLDDALAEIARLQSHNDPAELDRARTDYQSAMAELARVKARHAQEQAKWMIDYEVVAKPRTELETRFYTLQTQMADLREQSKTTIPPAELDSIQKEKAELARERDEARERLEQFQKASIGAESDLVAELKAEIVKLRQAREEEAANWEQERESIQRAQQEGSRQVEEERNKSSGLISELEATRVALEEARSTAEDRRREAAEAATAKSDLEQSLMAVEQQVKHLTADLDGERRNLNDTTSHLSAEREKCSTLHRDLDSARETLTAREETILKLQNDRSARDESLAAVQVQFERLSTDLEAERKVSADARKARETLQAQASQAANEITRLADALSKKQKEADEAIAEHSSEVKRLVSQLGQVDAGSQSEISRLHEELRIAKNSLSEFEQRLAGSTTELAALKQAKATLEGELADNQALIATTSRELKEARDSRHQIEQSGKHELGNAQAEIKKLREIIDGLERSLGEAAAAVTDLEGNVRSRDDLIASLRKDIESLKSRAQGAAEASSELGVLRKRLADTERDLQSERAEAQQTSAALATAESSAKAKSDELNRLTAEVASMSKSISELRGQMEQLQQRVKTSDEVALQAETTQETTRKLDNSLRAAEAEIKELRKQHDEARRSFLAAQAGQVEAKEKAISLGKELLEAKAALKGLESVRSQADASAKAAASASTAVSEAQEEIKRLEEVIEAQQGVIDVQREKILYWSNELEKQREVVRLLTQTPDAPGPSNGSNALTPKKMVDSPRRVSHGKSASLSAIRGAESPLAAGMGSTKTRVHIPSSFTARNLALPTSPPPLPMHGKQASNAGSKKGRRLTIEADMDRLSESNKVHRQRELFDIPSASPSPEKRVQPVTSVSQSGSLYMARQRRP